MERLTLDNAPDFLTLQQVADLLQVGRTTAWQLCHHGQLPSVGLRRNLRIPRKALIELADRKCRTNAEVSVHQDA